MILWHESHARGHAAAGMRRRNEAACALALARDGVWSSTESCGILSRTPQNWFEIEFSKSTQKPRIERIHVKLVMLPS